MDLNSLALIAQILGGVAVVFAVVFGVAQLRHLQQQRHDASALELMRSFQDSEFTRAFRLIYALPDGTRAAELRAMGPEYEDAALAIGTRFETVGLLVFRGNIPFRIVEDLVGGVAVALWRKLQPWVVDVRVEQNQKMFLEWFQWLAERMAERGRTEQVPAYERHRDWKPKH